ncbi:MAG: hypothetical protein RBS39_07665 [Phycisphaerales bacterium]|jgi:hypothetical protein|nr:hypothetical protein [Phycisphaerales bacterium]
MTTLRLTDDRAETLDTIPFPTRTRRLVTQTPDSIRLVEEAFRQVESNLDRLRSLAEEPLAFPTFPDDDGPRAA